MQKERKERIIVAFGPSDKRFTEKKLSAPAVVPNNDMKYELNKKKSAWIREQQEDCNYVLSCQR